MNKKEREVYNEGYFQGTLKGKRDAELMKENADGCKGCAFEDVESWQMPCDRCKRNSKDYWRAKKVKRMIRVTENYCIEVDEKCFTVKIDKHKEDKNGTPIFETVGYFSSLETAIKGVIISMNRKQLKDGIYTLKEALEIVKENNRKFQELLQEVMQNKGD